MIGNGDFVSKPGSSGRRGGAEQHQVQREGQDKCSTPGPRPHDDLRPSRSTCFSIDMAVPRQAFGGQPRKGSPSSHTAVHNAVMVQRALTQLQPMLHGAFPTEEIVKAMLDKITAEEKLNIKVQHLLEMPNVESSKQVPKSKAASKNAEKKLVVDEPELSGDQSFRQQLGSNFGFSRPPPVGGLPDRAGKERSAQSGALSQ